MKKIIKKKILGLTLIELLVAMVILALLATCSFILFSTYLKRARDTKRKGNLERIKTALYDYYFDANCFPKSLPACGTNFGVGSEIYLNNFPCDYQGKPYVYQTDDSDCPQRFKVLTNLEDTKDKGIDKVGCRLGCGPNCAYNYGLSSTNIRVYEGCVHLYACTPSGYCAEFIDPEASRCPVVFENDPTCNNNNCGPRKNRCHDERGKKS